MRSDKVPSRDEYIDQLFESSLRDGERVYAFGVQLRQKFIAAHGYLPEDSTTPRVPVTVDGPVDRDEYMAREYEREHGEEE